MIEMEINTQMMDSDPGDPAGEKVSNAGEEDAVSGEPVTYANTGWTTWLTVLVITSIQKLVEMSWKSPESTRLPNICDKIIVKTRNVRLTGLNEYLARVNPSL